MSRAAIFKDKTAITEKIREAAASVLPIVLIVVLLCFGVLPVGTDVMLSFLTGTLFVILGIGLFSYGVHAAHYNRNKPSPFAYSVLRGDICSELCLPLSIKLYGRGTAAGAIVFSLPVSEAAGFGMFEDTSGEEE